MTWAKSPATPRERLHALRRVMQAHGIDGWWLPSADPHLSEYLPEHWQGRAWVSGFDGSVGTLVVTRQAAGVWVDSRYWVQAEQQLAGSGIVLMRLHPGESQAPMRWLAEQLEPGDTVGCDAAVVSLDSARQLEAVLAPRCVQLHTEVDLLDEIWLDRPALPEGAVFEHAAPYACSTRNDKLAGLRERMAAHGADWHLVSTLDDIAWLTNLRGSDVDFNPVFLAHMLIGPRRVTLFVASGKLEDELRMQLERDGIDTAEYASVTQYIGALPRDSRVLLDPARQSLALARALPDGAETIEAYQPSTLAKGQKSAEEIEHVRHAMEEDGAALCEFFAWLENALARGEPVTELTIDEKITAARAAREGFVCRSFATIAGFNGNGALPHYHATQADHARIEGNGLLLIDSGGQYRDGTTDITRVVPIGRISDAQRHDFTRVLKGTIALSQTRFPRGFPAPQLDAIARAPLWAAGLDYGHGTGHGVGYFLNVHEGPQVIAWYAQAAQHTAMQPGMMTSIEPGLYRPGQWGIRIENLVVNQPAETGDFGEFLCFETLTLCPIDSRCIEVSLLTDEEIDWLNRYHATVRERLSQKVGLPASSWLMERTEPIGRP